MPPSVTSRMTTCSTTGTSIRTGAATTSWIPEAKIEPPSTVELFKNVLRSMPTLPIQVLAGAPAAATLPLSGRECYRIEAADPTFDRLSDILGRFSIPFRHAARKSDWWLTVSSHIVGFAASKRWNS